jgi:hypothetical protein
LRGAQLVVELSLLAAALGTWKLEEVGRQRRHDVAEDHL